MSWKDKVTVKSRQMLPEPLSLDEGSHILTVIDEPVEPIQTRFGERLAYRVKLEGSEDAKTLFIPYRESATTDSFLGQLKTLTDKHGSLKDKQLEVSVSGHGRNKRYTVNVVEQKKITQVELKPKETTAYCPNCGFEVHIAFAFCPKCGSDLT